MGAKFDPLLGALRTTDSASGDYLLKTGGNMTGPITKTDTIGVYGIGNTADSIVGRRAPQKMPVPIETMIYSPANDATFWTKAPAGANITTDTANYKFGAQSTKMVTDGLGGTCEARYVLSSALDLSTSYMSITLEVDDFTHYNDFQLRVSSDGFTNFSYCRPAYTAVSQRWVGPGKFITVTLTRSLITSSLGTGQWQNSGTGVNWASVTGVRIRAIDDNTSNPITVRINKISYFSQPPLGILSIVCDDSRASHETKVKPAFDKYGRGLDSAVIAQSVEAATAGTTTAYYTRAGMKRLQDSNWDIIGHAFTNDVAPFAHTLGYDGLTAADGLTDYLRLKDWMIANKCTGVDKLALPHGTYDLNANGTVNANTDVIGMVSQYVNLCRTTYSNTWETYPAADPMRLRAYSISAPNGDTAATLTALIDEVVVNNHGWLILNVHNVVDSGATGSTDFLTSEFNTLVDNIMSRVNGNTMLLKKFSEVLEMSNTVGGSGLGPLASKTAVTGTGSGVLSDSPQLTGTPVVPTATAGTNTTQIASTAFVKSAIVGYEKVAYGGTFSPADATTYFFGSLYNVVPGSTGGVSKLKILKAGTIKSAAVFINASPGTNEQSTLYLRVNNTTDYALSTTVDLSSAIYEATATLSIPVVVGDYIEAKWITPTWVTNPTLVRPSVTLYIEP